MARVRSLSLAGKTVNVPHSEHRESADSPKQERNSVTFGADGFAEVSDTLAASLLEFYPRDVEAAPKEKAKASAKA